jgi:hypothetical protein
VQRTIFHGLKAYRSWSTLTCVIAEIETDRLRSGCGRELREPASAPATHLPQGTHGGASSDLRRSTAGTEQILFLALLDSLLHLPVRSTSAIRKLRLTMCRIGYASYHSPSTPSNSSVCAHSPSVACSFRILFNACIPIPCQICPWRDHRVSRCRPQPEAQVTILFRSDVSWGSKAKFLVRCSFSATVSRTYHPCHEA